MIRLIKNITILFLCGILFYIGTLIADKQYLRDEILYIRIVYDSSIGIDQTDKSLLRNVFTSELSDIVFSEISFALRPSSLSLRISLWSCLRFLLSKSALLFFKRYYNFRAL